MSGGEREGLLIVQVRAMLEDGTGEGTGDDISFELGKESVRPSLASCFPNSGNGARGTPMRDTYDDD